MQKAINIHVSRLEWQRKELIRYHFAYIPLVIKMFRKKDGGISVAAKKRSVIGTFF
jgi:hypothetical protein